MVYGADTQTGAIVPRSKMEVALHSSAGRTTYMYHNHCRSYLTLCICVLPPIAAEYLRSRSWQGLEQRLGETEATEAVEGTTGVAAAYTHEHR